MKAIVKIIDDNGNIKGDYEVHPIDKYNDDISTNYVFRFGYSEVDYINCLAKNKILNNNLDMPNKIIKII